MKGRAFTTIMTPNAHLFMEDIFYTLYEELW